MKPRSRQYLFGLIFIGVAVYYAVRRDYMEVTLYSLAGLSFIVNSLTMEPRIAAYRKPLVVFSWLLIAVTGILFLYMLQFKYL